LPRLEKPDGKEITMARIRRVKLAATAWYHITARVANREFLLESDEKKSKFVEFLHRSLRFSGVELGTYAVMDNHVHLFVRVPEARELDDNEILRRIAALNGRGRADAVGERWASWREDGHVDRYEADRARYLRRMHDVSQFMKTLKELFTMWYNHRYRHVGTLWTGRFKSLLVEGGNYAEIVRVYIENNPVRARIVNNPADYRWNGIGAARLGDEEARRGQALLNCEHACEGTESGEVAGSDGNPDGAMPAGRVIAFTNGKILGSRDFVSRLIRDLGVFSRRTCAWQLRKAGFGNRTFAALGYRKDAIAIVKAA